METSNILNMSNDNAISHKPTKLWTIRLCSTIYFSLFQLLILAGYSSWQALLLFSLEIIVPYFLLTISLFPTRDSIVVNKRWTILWLTSWGVYWINIFILFYFNPNQLGLSLSFPKLHMEPYPTIMLMFMAFPLYMIYSGVLPLLKNYMNKRSKGHIPTEQTQ